MNFEDFKNKIYSVAESLKLGSKETNSVVGIDIGSSSIKIVQLKKQKERAVLETYGELDIGVYEKKSIGQVVHLDDQKTIQALKDISKEANINAKKAVVSIPLKNSFVSILNFPHMSEKELKQSIPFEIKKYIPVPISEVILGWQIIPKKSLPQKEDSTESDNAKDTTNDVLLAVVYKDAVEKLKSLVNGAGFDFLSFEIEIFGAIRSVLQREIYPVMLIDFGASTTKMTIVEDGITRFSFSLSKGSQDITFALARSLSIDFARAENLKREMGLSKALEQKEISDIIESNVNYVFSDANQMILEYRKKYGRSVEKVILNGGGSALSGIVEFAVNKFGIQTELANPFLKTQYPEFLGPVLKKVGPSFSNAIGLALRNL